MINTHVTINELFLFALLVIFVIAISDVYNKIKTEHLDNVRSTSTSVKSIDDSIELKFVDNLLSHEDCDYLINMSHGNFENSQVVSTSGDPEKSPDRTSQSYVVNEFDSGVNAIKQKIFMFLSNNINNKKKWDNFTEVTQIVKYEIGQQYKAHHDYFGSDYLEKNNQNQREYTIFIYLNDVDGGGETYFPKLNKRIVPKKGAALFWRNCTEANSCFSNSLHQGLPPKSGKKYGMNVWIRFNEL